MTYPTYQPTLIHQIIADNTADTELSSADWQTLVAEASHQGVAPLIYWKLSQAGKLSFLPDLARASLREAYAATWMANQKILQELELLARLFDKAGIPVVVLKGACFALTLYPDIGLRPMGDLDILVPQAKLDQAIQIAHGLGYTDSVPDTVPGLEELIGHHICLQKLNAPAHILEIHFSLVTENSFSYAVPVEWFWNQTQPLGKTLQEKYPNLLVLTPSAQILYAIAHAMLQHGGKNSPLRWFYDLDLLIRFYQDKLDWDELLGQARIFEWGSALQAALFQTKSYFNTQIPDTVLIRLQTLSDQHTRLVQNLQTGPATRTSTRLSILGSLSGQAQIKLLLASVLPTTTYMSWRYKVKNPWLLPVYYVLRWLDILKDALLTLTTIFKKGR